MELRYSNQPIKLRASESEVSKSIGTLYGHISVFNSDSVDLGGYIEQVKPGAFEESLKSEDVVALINHQHSVVVGRLSAGTLRLSEDEIGLRFEIDLPDTSFSRDLKVLVERGDLIGCSFGFVIEDATWSTRDKIELCVLNKLKLVEVSVGVTFPAYPESSMNLRSQLKERRDNRRARALAQFKFRDLYTN